MPDEQDILDELRQVAEEAIENEIPEAIDWALGLIRKLIHAKKSTPPATAQGSNPDQPPPPKPPGGGN